MMYDYIDPLGIFSHGLNQQWQNTTSNQTIGQERDQLRAENAKLRELVRWMYDRMDESCAVQYPHAPAPISYDRLMQALARVHELGIEVD